MEALGGSWWFLVQGGNDKEELGQYWVVLSSSTPMKVDMCVGGAGISLVDGVGEAESRWLILMI